MFMNNSSQQTRTVIKITKQVKYMHDNRIKNQGQILLSSLKWINSQKNQQKFSAVSNALLSYFELDFYFIIYLSEAFRHLLSDISYDIRDDKIKKK